MLYHKRTSSVGIWTGAMDGGVDGEGGGVDGFIAVDYFS